MGIQAELGSSGRGLLSARLLWALLLSVGLQPAESKHSVLKEESLYHHISKDKYL